jgi:hypothetical protein
MRLHEVFPDPPNDALRRAAVRDDWDAFVAAADAHPAPSSAVLRAEADALAARLEARAETGFVPARLADADPARPVVNAGQQAYIDYRLGMAAKVDALDACRAPAFCDWVEYDTFASDRLFSRTDLPSPDPRSAEPRLTLRFHPGVRAHGKKDLRRVPPPDAAALDRVRAELRGAVTLTARAVPGFDVRAARRALDEVWVDYAFAAARAEHAGDFNLLWTTRTLRRLGWRTPFVPLGELWDAPGIMRITAETLVPFVRENACFVEAANEGIRLAAPHHCGMSPRETGHLPLAMTDPATGIRFPVRVARRGADHVIEGAGAVPFSASVGGAGEDELLTFLHAHRGRVTPNVFAPIFQFRAGVGGVLNGKGAIRYTLVVAHVLERLFGVPHPPNFLCAGPYRGPDPFADARAAAGTTPAEVEPTLLARLLAAGPDAVRAETAAVWR